MGVGMVLLHTWNRSMTNRVGNIMTSAACHVFSMA